MDYEKTGSLIASLRKEKGFTQKDLADKLGITDRAISKWERGLGCPDISLLDDLSKILDISILEILKGRRLDKDEIVNNESMIESMNYSKENIKYKFKKYFNIVSIALIIIICSLLVIYNLKSIYYLNKTYHASYDISNKNIFNEININIKLIKNNQGKYSDEDYKNIIEFINEFDKNLKIQNNSYYFNKNDYTFSELVKFHWHHQIYMYTQITSSENDTIYKIIHKYNPDVVDNIVSYYRYSDWLIEDSIRLSDQIKKPYYNNEKVNSEIATTLQSFIDTECERDNMLLKDIIKVGDINE